MKKEVYWYIKRQPNIKKLDHDTTADTVIVGGGMAGLTAARRLSEAGQKVVLLECSFCGGGASGKSSGFITPDSELQLADLQSKYGNEDAKKLRVFANSGVEEIRQNIEKHHIDCDYQYQDSLFVANTTHAYEEKVKSEHQARVELGYESQLYSEDDLPEILNSHKYVGGVRYGATYGINSYLYCQAMKEILEQEGVEIYENTPVAEIQNGLVKTGSHEIKTKNIIIATDHFMPKLKQEIPSVYHAQTFLAVSKPLSNDEIKKIFPDSPMMVWDSDLIYQYFRLVEGNRLLIGASNLIYTYQKKESNHFNFVITKMEKYLKNKFDLDIEFEYSWPGLIGVAKDLVPIAGRDPVMKDVYFLSAATGLPWAAALGNYLAEKILNGRSDYDQFFTPYRKYPISHKLQFVLSKPVAFALSHGIIKYLE